MDGTNTRARTGSPPGTDADRHSSPAVDQALPEDLLTLPPIPLATGNASLDSAGHAHRVTGIDMVVTADDGTVTTLPLTYRHGGWWAPRGR